MSTNLFNPADKRIYTQRWPLLRGKQLFAVQDTRSEEGTEELLSVSHITGITPRSQKNVTMFQSESLVGYKICNIGDIAANTMWTWQGAIGVSKYYGVISPAYNVYRQRREYFNPRFLDLLLREQSLVDVYHSLSTGIRPSRLRLYPDDFLTISFPVPPMDEQNKIIQYLDWQLSSINGLIATHKKEIILLNELKECIIDKAVIHGLSSNTELRQNNAWWEVDYPENWSIKRTREIFRFRKGLSITKANLEETGIPVISYGQVHSKMNTGTGLSESLIRYVNESYLEEAPSALVQEGDFIFADTSEDVKGCGNFAYVDRTAKIFAGYHTIIAHASKTIETKYLAYLFMSPTWRTQIWKKANGVKVYSITQKMLKDTFVLIPPDDEQHSIVEYLDAECAKIDEAISSIYIKIGNLSVLKKQLISEVLTGRIDVREVEIPEYEYVADLSDEEESEDDEEVTELEQDE